MASEKLTEYELKRLENIRRNDEMLAALKIQSKATELFAAAKRQRVEAKSYNVKSEKKPKTETPVVIRRSLRSRGMPPDSKGLSDDSVDTSKLKDESPTKFKASDKISCPITIAYDEAVSDRPLIEAIMGMSKRETHSRASNGEVFSGSKDGDFLNDKREAGSGVSFHTEKRREDNAWTSLQLQSLTLKAENVARVVPGRITSVRFFPSSNARMIVAGNKFGNVGFWNVDFAGDEGNGIYLYRPHKVPISGILVQEHCLSKIYTSCYDGFIRMMDAENQAFNMVFSSDDSIFSLSQPTNDVNSFYIGEGRGGLSIWDNRVGKCSSKLALHEDRINTIDFNSRNPHIIATGSSDATACTWDLRSINGDQLKVLSTFTHKRAVQSAYFSRSGCTLATTSTDDVIGIYTGANFEDASTIYHYNQTGRWLSSFRAIWGWDDSNIFIGNMKRGVDVVSPVERSRVMTLQSPLMTAIPCRFDAHPYEIGTLAGATSGGQVYMWTTAEDAS
ncbi:hypothetical protein L6164_014231 [Bauhinia variegata]|uniref:Uncharacterized protein n=1 Tax=Bauhinia variegata TaxID=167791 RepID=A0ACB9NI39_BAUVA|nr:hypothetical protein L6164_014231 [Bauhinia variegata]